MAMLAKMRTVDASAMTGRRTLLDFGSLSLAAPSPRPVESGPRLARAGNPRAAVASIDYRAHGDPPVWLSVETLWICSTGKDVEEKVVSGFKTPPPGAPCAAQVTPQVIVAVTGKPASFGLPVAEGSPADERL